MRFPRLAIQSGAAAWIIFLAAACAGPAPTSTLVATPTLQADLSLTTQAPAKADSVNLPNDEGVHLAPVEWWYFNGHLDDSAGNQYSFHFVTFITVTPDGEIPLLMQLSLADHGAVVYLTDEEPSLVNKLQPTHGSFSFDSGGWFMAGDGSSYELIFDTGDYSVEMAAISKHPAILHQGLGLVNLGRAGNTYYYSRTGLDVTGTLIRNGAPTQITGIAWMDHQWGDLNTLPIGWDWASIQLDDGSGLMISLVWDSSTGQPITSYGTYVPAKPNGRSTGGDAAPSRHLPGDDISLTPTGAWTSPATGVEYPSGWLLEISSLDLSVKLAPVHQNAEFGDSLYVPIAYWEGAVAVEGTKEGNIISGKGFVELVGYDKARPVSEVP